jgi:hypothetical protein
LVSHRLLHSVRILAVSELLLELEITVPELVQQKGFLVRELLLALKRGQTCFFRRSFFVAGASATLVLVYLGIRRF